MMRKLTLSLHRHRYPAPVPAAMHDHQGAIPRQIFREASTSSSNIHDSSTLCFTGHRILRHEDARWLPERLDAVLASCYERGFRQFLSGGAIGFDTLAAEAVLRLEKKHPDVRLVLVLPCSDQASRWTNAQCQRFERLLYRASDVRVLNDTYFDGCMLQRNRAMIEQSSLCICYLYVNRGGTLATVHFAAEERVPVLNIAVEPCCQAFIARREAASWDAFA